MSAQAGKRSAGAEKKHSQQQPTAEAARRPRVTRASELDPGCGKQIEGMGGGRRPGVAQGSIVNLPPGFISRTWLGRQKRAIQVPFLTRVGDFGLTDSAQNRPREREH